MRVVLWEGDDVLRVPTSALFRQGEERFVFVNECSKARAPYAIVSFLNIRFSKIVQTRAAPVATVTSKNA